MPTWPATLPQTPNAQGYSEQPQSQVLRSSMDAGPAKTRRRFTAAARTIPVQYWLDKTQVATFEAFFENDIAGGALPFDWPQPRTGEPVEVLIAGDTPYELTPLGSGVYWVLSLQLEVQP